MTILGTQEAYRRTGKGLLSEAMLKQGVLCRTAADDPKPTTRRPGQRPGLG